MLFPWLHKITIINIPILHHRFQSSNVVQVYERCNALDNNPITIPLWYTCELVYTSVRWNTRNDLFMIRVSPMWLAACLMASQSRQIQTQRYKGVYKSFMIRLFFQAWPLSIQICSAHWYSTAIIQREIQDGNTTSTSAQGKRDECFFDLNSFIHVWLMFKAGVDHLNLNFVCQYSYESVLSHSLQRLQGFYTDSLFPTSPGTSGLCRWRWRISGCVHYPDRPLWLCQMGSTLRQDIQAPSSYPFSRHPCNQSTKTHQIARNSPFSTCNAPKASAPYLWEHTPFCCFQFCCTSYQTCITVHWMLHRGNLWSKYFVRITSTRYNRHYRSIILHPWSCLEGYQSPPRHLGSKS